MLKKKWFWIVIIVVVLVAVAGGYYYYSSTLRTTTTRASGTQAPVMQTAVARRGDITLSASGTGKVIPVSEGAPMRFSA